MNSPTPNSYSLKESIAVRFQNIDPLVFENFIGSLFEKKGYETEVTSKSGDYGADVIAAKENFRIAIQVKRNAENNSVGIQAITHLHGAMKYYSCQKAICITTSNYTQPAIEMANRLGVEIWDWERTKREFIDACEISDENPDANLIVDAVPSIRLADAAVMAKEFDVTKDEIRLACINGEIPGAQPKGASDWLIPQGSFEEWLTPIANELIRQLEKEKQRQIQAQEARELEGRIKSFGCVAVVIILVIIVFTNCVNTCSGY